MSDRIRYAGFDATDRDHRDYFGVRPETVLSFFRRGLDTAQIADKFKGTSEARIYSLLAWAREKERDHGLAAL